MNAVKFFIILNILDSRVIPAASEVDLSRYNEGKRQFELLQYQSEMPQYGQCWIDAMTTIRTGCKQLTDETQSRLALAYLNCFLKLQDLEMYTCHSGMEIRDCTKSLRESDRSSFTTFFTHTQNICYFLQGQMWHEETELTISRLADRSSQVASQLEAAYRLQEDMIISQSQSLENQKELMDGTHNLRGIINSSSHNVLALFEDLKLSTLEQRQIIGDVFNHLVNLQSTILGEVSGFYSFFFYILSLSVCYILTSTARTSGARLWLFLVMSANIFLEQTLMRWIAGGKDDVENLYWLQKQCRRFFMLVAVAILCLKAYMYRDVNELNNQLLTEIRKQNSDIKRFVSGQIEKFLPVQPSSSARPSHDPSSDSDYTSDNSQENDSDESDHTFILGETSKQSDGDESPNNSLDEDTQANTSSLFSELYDLRNSTPVREMEDRVSSWLSQSVSGENQNESPVRLSSPSHQVNAADDSPLVSSSSSPHPCTSSERSKVKHNDEVSVGSTSSRIPRSSTRGQKR